MPATNKVPFGRLVSFGSIVFTGGGAPANTDNDTSANNEEPEWDRPRHQHPNGSNPFGISVYGYSPGPFKGITSKWTVVIKAADGLSEAATWQAVEDCWNTWMDALRGTHTHRGTAGVTGQVGDLVALDAYGNTYKAEAELAHFPTQNKPGEIAMMELELTFTLNEYWTYVP